MEPIGGIPKWPPSMMTAAVIDPGAVGLIRIIDPTVTSLAEAAAPSFM